jgi:HEAT repeat protein
MKKRRIVGAAAVFGLAVAAMLLVPWSRSMVLGVVRQEHFERGRPLNYWLTALHDRDSEQRWRAATVIGEMGSEGKDGVPELGKALHDDEPHVRVNAALALMKIGPDARAAVPDLSTALDDEVPIIRMDAAITLNRLGHDAQPAIPALVNALRDEDNRRPMSSFGISVCRVVARALGHIGPDAKDAIPALTQVLESNDPEMRHEVEEALQQIDPDSAARIIGDHPQKPATNPGKK